MGKNDRTAAYCIIGAGSSGLVAAKNLKHYGIRFEVIEAEDDVGGNWYYGKPHSSVYRSTHLISSKPLTEYTNFPMPESYPGITYLDSTRHYVEVEHFSYRRRLKKLMLKLT